MLELRRRVTDLADIVNDKGQVLSLTVTVVTVCPGLFTV